MRKRASHTAIRTMICLAMLAATLPPAPAWSLCPGDLNADGSVRIDEVLTLVDEALSGCAGVCSGDSDGDGLVSVVDILAAANSLLEGCPKDFTPTPTPTPTDLPPSTATPTASPSPTVTVTPDRSSTPASCPFTFDDATLSQNILCDFVGPFSSESTCPSDLEALFTSDGGGTVGVAIGTAEVVMFVGEKVSSTEANLLGYTIGEQTVLTPLSGKIELQQGGRMLVIAPDHSPFDLGLDQQLCSFDRFTGSFIGVLGGASSPAPNRAPSVRFIAWAPGSTL